MRLWALAMVDAGNRYCRDGANLAANGGGATLTKSEVIRLIKSRLMRAARKGPLVEGETGCMNCSYAFFDNQPNARQACAIRRNQCHFLGRM